MKNKLLQAVKITLDILIVCSIIILIIIFCYYTESVRIKKISRDLYANGFVTEDNPTINLQDMELTYSDNVKVKVYDDMVLIYYGEDGCFPFSYSYSPFHKTEFIQIE